MMRTRRAYAATSVRVSMLPRSFHPNLTKEPDFCELRQTIGIVRVRLVRRHIERRLSMARIDADRRQPLPALRMIKPYRQWSGLEHHAFHGWCPLADELGYDSGIRYALAAPDPFWRSRRSTPTFGSARSTAIWPSRYEATMLRVVS